MCYKGEGEGEKNRQGGSMGTVSTIAGMVGGAVVKALCKTYPVMDIDYQ
jgi:hypothetical protein